jgi:cell division septation protein DedD
VAPAAGKPEAVETKPVETPKTAAPVADTKVAAAKQAETTAAPPAPEPATSEESLTAPPVPGQTYLQVAAVRRPEAELMVDVLKRRGFAARIAPVPDKAEFRVLVGPIKDAAALAKTQSDLALAGFRSIVRKY